MVTTHFYISVLYPERKIAQFKRLLTIIGVLFFFRDSIVAKEVVDKSLSSYFVRFSEYRALDNLFSKEIPDFDMTALNAIVNDTVMVGTKKSEAIEKNSDLEELKEITFIDDFVHEAIPEKIKVSPEEVYLVADIMPEFPGGKTALKNFIAKNVKYPAVAEEKGIQGRVSLSFVVNTDGSIADIEIVGHLYPSLDEEAVRLVRSMPKWKPGMIQNQIARVKYRLPVDFRIKNYLGEITF